jgi:hypothetical protein
VGAIVAIALIALMLFRWYVLKEHTRIVETDRMGRILCLYVENHARWPPDMSTLITEGYLCSDDRGVHVGPSGSPQGYEMTFHCFDGFAIRTSKGVTIFSTSGCAAAKARARVWSSRINREIQQIPAKPNRESESQDNSVIP